MLAELSSAEVCQQAKWIALNSNFLEYVISLCHWMSYLTAPFALKQDAWGEIQTGVTVSHVMTLQIRVLHLLFTVVFRFAFFHILIISHLLIIHCALHAVNSFLDILCSKSR